MNGRHFMAAGVVATLVVGLVLLCVVAGIAMSMYNMGVMQGVVGGGRYAPAPAAPAPSTGPNPYPYYGPGFHPFGSIFSFLGPLFGILILFALIRCLFRPWGWHRRWHQAGGWGGGGVPPMFEEWHRRAHQPGQPGGGTGQQQNQQPNQQAWGQPPYQQPNQQAWGQPPYQQPPYQQPPTQGPNPER